MTVIQNLVSDAILSSYAGKVERPRTSAPSIRQLDPNLTPTYHEHNVTPRLDTAASQTQDPFQSLAIFFYENIGIYWTQNDGRNL